MNIDSASLFGALKKPQTSDSTDADKCKDSKLVGVIERSETVPNEPSNKKNAKKRKIFIMSTSSSEPSKVGFTQ